MLLLSCLTGAAVHAAEPEPFTVVAFGDSLTSGHRLPLEEAYPALLEARLASAGLPFRVLNHGVSGDTTDGGLRRLEAALAPQPHIMILELGANDGLRGVPVARVRENLERIIETAQRQGVKVLLCAMDALPRGSILYTLDFHRMYFELAAKYQLPLVPNLLGPVIGNPELMTPDGVHPNREGARVLADMIWRYLQPLAASVARQAGAADR